MTIRQTTAHHHKLPQTTTNHRKPPQTTSNHHKPPPEFETIGGENDENQANHHQNTSKKESNCQFCGLNLAMARRNIICLCHSCCLHDFSICKQLFYIEKHWHVCNNQDWVCVVPPIEYVWCLFKMTSSKCPYRSKHQVIILTVIYRPETLYITHNKHGMLFTGTRIHIVPSSAYLRRFGGDLWWFAYKASCCKSPQTTTETS